MLEVVAEPPRLRQDGELFQKELDRFLATPAELPAALVDALDLSREKRLRQAKDWALNLRLVGTRSEAKQSRLEISIRGDQWLAGGLLEQYRTVYEFLQPGRAEKVVSVSDTDDDLNYYHSLYALRESHQQFLGVNVVALPTRPGVVVQHWNAKNEDHQALRDALDRSLSTLPPGVFYPLDNVLDHLVCEQHNPFSLGLPFEKVVLFHNGRTLPPLPELRDQAGREMLTEFLRKRLIPLGCFRAAIDAEGRLCIARHRLFDMYFGRKVDDTVLAAPGRSDTRVVVQPDFSIIVIGLHPAPAAELIGFCERDKRSGHGALTLRVTRESVVKAVAYGMKPEEIVNRLRRHASNELPANVLREVTEWGGWVRRAQASKVTILRCPDPETADRIMAVMKRQAERLAETIVALDQLKITVAERNKLRDQGILIEGKEI